MRFASRPAGASVLIDKFLEDAIESMSTAIATRRQVVIAGIMEHIEEAGIHSGTHLRPAPYTQVDSQIEDTGARPWLAGS